MTDPVWDTIIVGQGLAGTTLAWHLIEAGQRVLIIDDGAPSSASRITPGLITPITGRRLTPVDGHVEMHAAAEAFYTRIGGRLGRTLYRRHTAVRLFSTAAQAADWDQCKADAAVRAHLVEPTPLLPDGLVDAPHGGFSMQAAQVDAAGYLEASRARIPVVTAKVDWRADVVFDAGGVEVLGQRASRVIACDGFAAMHSPHFGGLPFQNAKGEILTIRFPVAVPRVSLHRSLWLAPTADPHVFHAGSTSEWTTLDHAPTEAARHEIEMKLRGFVCMPYEVVDHRAAVRPIIRGRMPKLGLHPAEPRLGIFNGLATKGVIRAPWFARLLADHLVRGTALPTACAIESEF